MTEAEPCHDRRMGSHGGPFRSAGRAFEDRVRPLVLVTEPERLELAIPWRRSKLTRGVAWLVPAGLLALAIVEQLRPSAWAYLALIVPSCYVALLVQLGETHVVLDVTALRVRARRIWRPFAHFTIPRAELASFSTVVRNDGEGGRIARLAVRSLRGQRTILTTDTRRDARSAERVLHDFTFGRDAPRTTGKHTSG